MKHRIAFAGFRHPHILSLWDRVTAHSECETVGACEPDPSTRERLQSEGRVVLTHNTFDSLIADSGCTIVAIGDVYARRGALAVAALNAGLHVISDKPICTSLEELEQITCLSKENALSVGCQLDLVEAGSMRQLKEVICTGILGRICTITVMAQHPLRFGTRAEWYFEPGQHGGTINDIGVHVFDLASWLTASKWEVLLTAREWNAKAKATPHFKDCAQFYGLLADGSTCFADVSYLAPDKLGYELPQYWRVTVHGTQGMAEANYGSAVTTVVTDNDSAPLEMSVSTENSPDYLQDLLCEISGSPSSNGITTERVLCAARWALKTQQKARTESKDQQ